MRIFLYVFLISIAFYHGAGYTQVPLQQDNPLVINGTDIMIYNNPLVTQDKFRCNAALNNRIYVPIVCKDSTKQDWLRCFESSDLGLTWNNLYSESRLNPIVFLDAMMTNKPMSGGLPGDTVYYFNAYTVFSEALNGVFLYVTRNGIATGFYSSITPVTWTFDYNQNWISNVNIAGSLFSEGTTYKDGVAGFCYALERIDHSGDSLFFHVSTDNGSQFGPRKLIAACPPGKAFRSVSLTYTSTSLTSGGPGTYFASWVVADTSTWRGNLYVSRTLSGPVGDWSEPVRLDIIAGAEGSARQIAMSVQENGSNDVNDVTCVVLLEKAINYENIDILGLYNKTSLSSGNWQPFSLVTSPGRYEEPSIITSLYPADMFYVTYYDWTNTKLKAYKQTVNMPDPSGWTCISQGYSDNDKLLLPEPRIWFNRNGGYPGFAWMALVSESYPPQAVYIDNDPTVGTGELTDPITRLKVVPNPAAGYAVLSFHASVDRKATVEVYNNLGRKVIEKMVRMAPGNNELNLNLAGLSSGLYIVRINSGTATSGCRLVINDLR